MSDGLSQAALAWPGDTETEPATHRLGRLRIGLAGAGEVFEHILEEMAPIRTSDSAPPHLRIRFVPELPQQRQHISNGWVHVNEDNYRITDRRLSYLVTDRRTCCEVLIQSHVTRRGDRDRQQRVPRPAWWRRAGHWNYLLPTEDAARHFIYAIFDHLTQLAQMPLGQSYLHAGALERDGSAVALAAWGGVGKTSTVLSLVGRDGWRFLSDDLAAIDETAVMSRAPKRMQIYPYNVNGRPDLLRTLMRGRSLPDRLSWRYRQWRYGAKAVRRRVGPEQIFAPEHIADHGRVRMIVLLERADQRSFETTSIVPGDFARRAAATLDMELKPFDVIAAAISTSDWPGHVPERHVVLDQSRAIFERAARNVEIRRVRVPAGAGPDDLSRYLQPLLDEATRPHTAAPIAV